jgi:hypothetical protein
MLRCLLLLLLSGQASINRWTRDLAANRVLRILPGLPEDGRPGVGTLYDFLHRLHDGPVRGSCEHQGAPARPSGAARARPARSSAWRGPRPRRPIR